MSGPRAEDQFHVGVIVDDLPAAKDNLSRLFGYEWTVDISAMVTVGTPTGPLELDMQLVYSVSVPHVELVRTIPGTLWSPAEGSGIHHVGYWSGDVKADSARLEEAGYEWEASGEGPDGTPMWTYHRHPQGVRVELVSRQLEAGLSSLWVRR